MVDASIRQTFLDIVSNENAIPRSVNPTEFVLTAIPLIGRLRLGPQ